MKHLQLEDSSNVIWIYLGIDFHCKITPPPPTHTHTHKHTRTHTHKHTRTHTECKDNRQLNRHSLCLWLNQLFHRLHARIMGEVSFGDIWYISSQCHAKGSRLIMQLFNHGRGCPCFILALLKLNKGIYIVISWNNGSAVVTLQNDNQTICYAVSLNVVIQYLYLGYESWVALWYNEMPLSVFYSRHTMAPLHSYGESFYDITK